MGLYPDWEYDPEMMQKTKRGIASSTTRAPNRNSGGSGIRHGALFPSCGTLWGRSSKMFSPERL